MSEYAGKMSTIESGAPADKSSATQTPGRQTLVQFVQQPASHTVQQVGGIGLPTKLEVSSPGDAAERGADAAAATMVRGEAATVGSVAGGAIARAPQPGAGPVVPTGDSAALSASMFTVAAAAPTFAGVVTAAKVGDKVKLIALDIPRRLVTASLSRAAQVASLAPAAVAMRRCQLDWKSSPSHSRRQDIAPRANLCSAPRFPVGGGRTRWAIPRGVHPWTSGMGPWTFRVHGLSRTYAMMASVRSQLVWPTNERRSVRARGNPRDVWRSDRWSPHAVDTPEFGIARAVQPIVHA